MFDEVVICREDAICLADKLKKITVADIIKSMKVSVVPVAVRDGCICSIYKLVMKLYKPKHYPKYTDITLDVWEETLRVGFVRELEDAIENHITLLSKISGIKNFKTDPESNSSNGLEDVHGNGSESEKKGQANDDDDDDGGGVEDTEGTEDLGLDAQKRKQQGTDEVDYEDGPEEEMHDGELSEEIEEGDEDGNNTEVNEDDENVTLEANNSQGLESPSKPKSIDEKDGLKAEKRKSGPTRKKYDRAVFVKAEGMHFEIHFKFTDEPHILLAQVLSSATHFLFSKQYNYILLGPGDPSD